MQRALEGFGRARLEPKPDNPLSGTSRACFGVPPASGSMRRINTSKFRNRLIATAATAAVALSLSLPVSALEIKSSDVHPMGYPTTDAIEYMGQLLNTWTGGRLNNKIYHSMQLGGEKEALEQVQLGALEMTRVSVGVVGPIV